MAASSATETSSDVSLSASSPTLSTTSSSASNSSLTSPLQDGSSTADPALHTYSLGDFFIGFLVSLGSSAMNAAGLNITKLDHLRNEALPRRSRRPDYTRPLWYIGLILYILSQLVGSTLALAYLRAEYVAPLGSAALIFNLLFGHWLLHEPVTRKDILGTVTIVVGVIFVLVFSNINDGLTEADNITLESLQRLWARGGFIAYFLILNLVVVGLTLFANLLTEIISDLDNDDAPALGHGGLPPSVNIDRLAWRRRWAVRFRVLVETRVMFWEVATLRKFAALIWAGAGGLYASETLLLAKCAVKLGTTGNGAAQFVSFLGILLILILAVTAVAQVYALNMGLKMGDSTLVVPFFFGLYTALGLCNSMVYFDQLGAYRTWTVFMLVVSVMILVAGVIMLSTVKKPVRKEGPPGVVAPNSGLPKAGSVMELSRRQRSGSGAANGDSGPSDDHSRPRSTSKSTDGGANAWHGHHAGLQDLADDAFFEDEDDMEAPVMVAPSHALGGEHSGLMRGAEDDEMDPEGETDMASGDFERDDNRDSRRSSSLGFFGFLKKDPPKSGLLSNAAPPGGSES